MGGFFPNTNSVGRPIWVKSQDAISEGDETDLELEQDPAIEAWVTPLHTWLLDSANLMRHISPSSVMVGKVMPRLFYGLENISDSLRKKTANYSTDFASAMELFALCVVNAFLAEESASHLTESSKRERIILNNPKTSAAKYLNQLKKVPNNISRTDLPLTYIIATCPLITGLISEEKVNASKSLILDKIKYQLGFDSFISSRSWGELNKVSIASQKDDDSKKEKEKEKEKEKKEKGEDEDDGDARS